MPETSGLPARADNRGTPATITGAPRMPPKAGTPTRAETLANEGTLATVAGVQL
jgi:hypothetical protein